MECHEKYVASEVPLQKGEQLSTRCGLYPLPLEGSPWPYESLLMVVVYETLLQEPLPFNESTSLPPPSVGSTSTLPALNTSTSSGSSWGPRRDPLYVVIPVTALYGAIFVAGLLGNVSTCVVIARNRHLHTATNYYLFSLAVSDLLLLVAGLPPEMYYIWSKYPYVFGEAFCVLQGFAAETSANATVLTITAFTVERYVAICHPFQAHAMSRLSRAVRFVLAIWLLALGLAVPQASQFGVVQERLPDGRVLDADHAVCAVKRVLIPHAFEISTCVFFVAPMTLITVLYVLIGVKLRRSSLLARRDAGGSNYARSAHSTASRHVVKMLVAVVVAFFICWAPFHAQRLLAVYASPSDAGRPSHVTVVVYHALTYVSGVLYYLSTTVNPVLYHIMSHKFREAFKV
ncbi:pyrokinin-1 receptor-like [Anabrus simplex]|uniref:pyrokinin-1 receptor-like n=1 Tax=Anabrus simplex TaxID=316456 RepID=UPI0035A2A0D9